MAELFRELSALAPIASASIAGIAVTIGLKTYAHHRTSYDVNLALTIFKEINRYWDKIVKNKANADYLYGQVLAHFEIAAALFNKGILTDKARDILADHIIEVFTELKSTSAGSSLLARCRSSADTFKEIERFAQNMCPSLLSP